MLKRLSSKAQGCKIFENHLNPVMFGIHWIALAEYSQMSTHLPEFQPLSGVLHHFVLAKLPSSSIHVKCRLKQQ